MYVRVEDAHHCTQVVKSSLLSVPSEVGEVLTCELNVGTKELP